MDIEERVDLFETVFFHDIESWFSRDIACCDLCYEDFIKEWPYAYSADEARFQCESISLDCFYSGSRLLQDVFTHAEFLELLPYIMCPNCGKSLKNWIWPYELPFTPPQNFDQIIEEISYIARTTPFLLLSHRFSLDIFNMLNELSSQTPRQNYKEKLFRGRSLNPSAIQLSPADFDFPPKNVIKSEGRYNHVGDSVLYLASTEEVCKEEMRNSPSLIISSFDYTADLKILDLMTPHETEHNHSELLSFIIFSSLLSARSNADGFHRPEYVFSRFVKDCAVHAGFDAIKYPSTRVGTARYNLVVLKSDFCLTACTTNFTYSTNV